MAENAPLPNFYSSDSHLHDTLAFLAADDLSPWTPDLESFGAWAAGPCDTAAAYTDRHARPLLEAFDRDGLRTNRIVHSPGWEASSCEVYRRGIVGLNYGNNPAPFLVTFAMGYMLSQADVSLHCPVTMTGAVAHVLNRFAPQALSNKYLPQLTRRDGHALSGGTWATELHGGSDIGATTTVATPDGNGAFRLNGLKWFTSNANGGLALATARAKGEKAPGSKGLGVYLVPTHLEDGSPNPMIVRRLKDKLGTCAVPTGEIDLTDTFAEEIAAAPEGFKLMMEALGFSRIHNALAAAGIQRRAFTEALAFAEDRQAFGHNILTYPMVREEFLKLVAPLEAGLLLSFEAARAFDAAHHIPLDETENPARVWLRLSTALAKYLTAEDAIHGASRAIEIIGGNGYVYDRITPRLLRDAQVLTVWEGPANIQALEMLRLLGPRFGGATAFVRHIEDILARLPDIDKPAGAAIRAPFGDAFTACREGLATVARDAGQAPRHARRLLHLLAETYAAALLLQRAGRHWSERGDRRAALVARWYVENRLAPRPFQGIAGDPDWTAPDFTSIMHNEMV